FIFGFSKLDVMFGRTGPDAVHHPYRDLVKPGVQFVQATVTAIEPVAKRVETDAGTFDADILVIALGADLHPEATPGLVERGLDPARNVATFADGSEMPYDLFLGVPVHRVPTVVAESGMTVDGWIPVDPLTLETSYPGVFAVGDVTSVGTPKAGVFAEGQAV